MKQPKKPALRFKGFVNDWEQRKLGDIVDFLDTQRKPLTENIREKGPYPYYGASGIVDYVAGYIFDEELVLLSEDGANITDRNYPVCFLASGKYWVNNHAHVLKTKEGIDNNFICNSLECKDFSIYNTGMAMPKLNQDICKKIPVDFPTYDEQEKIGNYFRNIDYFITLHQRKLEKLQNLKKAMLEKMFPKNGAKVPEIRFKGFTDDWEQRKLEDLASFSKGSGYSKSDLQASGTPIVLYGRLYTKYETVIKDIDTFVDALADSVYSQGGEVIVPASGETAEDISIASVVEKPGIVLGGDLNIIHPTDDLDSTFLAISISHGNPHKEMAKRAQGKSVVHLHNNDLAQIKLWYPSVTEQRKISQYFSGLDTLITLHQRKLEKLQNLKKAMLEKMFI